MNILKKSLKELNESKRVTNCRKSSNNYNQQSKSKNNRENDDSEKYIFI